MGTLIGRLLNWLGFDQTIEFKKTLTKTTTREIKEIKLLNDQLGSSELKQLLSHAHPVRDLSDLPPELATNPEVQKLLSQAKSGGPYPASLEANLPPELASDPQVQEMLKEGKPLIFTSTEVKNLSPEAADDPKIQTYVKAAPGNWSPVGFKALSWTLLVVLGAILAVLLILLKRLPGSP